MNRTIVTAILCAFLFPAALQAQDGERGEPRLQITNFRPHSDAIPADSIQPVTETCLVEMMPETRYFEDEESEEAEAYFTSMDDRAYYSWQTRRRFERMGVKSVLARKRYLSFEIDGGEKIIVDTRDEQNGHHVDALLYKRGRIPMLIDIVINDMDSINAYLEDVIYNFHYEDDGTFVEECAHLNKTMRQVYEIAKREDSRLKPELPAADLQYCDSGCGDVEYDPEHGTFGMGNVLITYTYKDPKHLLIELGYDGGVTTIELVESESGTTSKITYSAD
jgi:hypothetical protein